MNLGGADRQIDAHLGHRRARPVVAQQLGENQNVLRAESGLRHLIFAIREHRIAQLERPCLGPAVEREPTTC